VISLNYVNNVSALLVSVMTSVVIIGLCFKLAVFNLVGDTGSSRMQTDGAGGGLHDVREGYR
jgi:hypothetical protein